MAAHGARLTRRAALLTVVPTVFLVLLFVLPVGAVVLTGLREDGSWDPSGTLSAAREVDALGLAWFTVWQAAASSALTQQVALPGAYAMARFRFPGRSVLQSAVVVPFVLPPVVVGAALGWGFDALLGTSPWGLIVFLLMGFAAGILSLMRTAGLIAKRPGLDDDPASRRFD